MIWDEITGEKVDAPTEALLGQHEGALKRWVLERPEGRRIPIECCASRIRGRKQARAGIVLTFKDVTARRHAEEMLLKLSNAVEKTADLVVITNKEGLIEYVNPAFEQTTGYSRQEALGSTPRLLKSPRHSPDFFKRLWESILSGQVFRAVMINQKKNGELYYEDKTISPIEDASGTITHFVSIGNDVTEMRQLEQSVLHATEKEQQRIGRDLHDGLGQLLTGISCFMVDLEQSLLEKKRAEGPRATRLVELVNQAIKETRLIARGLTKDRISQSGLFSALRGLAVQVSDVYQISCGVTGVEEIHFDGPDTALHLYRMVQEAVNNAIRHGMATEITIDLSLQEHTLTLTIKDNGKGFDDAAAHTPGIGLQTMAYRADLIGGSLEVTPDAAGGVLVVCTCPTTQRILEYS